MPQQFLDSFPPLLLFAVIVVAMLAVFEIGYRAGVYRETRNPDEKDGPTGALVGSLLALMAFLLAITMGMAGDRFDTRRALVQTEANAIGTTYLRAGYLPQPQGEQIRNLMREYVSLRIGTTDAAQVDRNIARSYEILDEAWAITEALAIADSSSETLSLFIDSLNETIDVGSSRVTAVQARVPEPIILFVIGGSIVAVALVGYGAGLTRRRSLVAAVLLIIVFSTVMYLVIDINQPASGVFTVSQQPLLTLQEQIGPPTP